jgi:hypothetical protein
MQPQLPAIWRPYAEAAIALGARSTAAALAPGRSSARLDELARRLHRELDHMMEKAFAALPGGGELACAPGCDVCCRSLPVGVLPLEVFTVVHRLQDVRATDAALDERLVTFETTPATEDATGSTGDSDATVAGRPHTGVLAAGVVPAPGSLGPCPMLGAGGLCLIYSSRPLACRGCVSGDEAACAACDDTVLVPRSTAHQLGAAAVAKGAGDALEALGLTGRPVELRAGLALALRDPGAEKRWLRGEDVFAGLG